jgi:Tfp pilus assembly protein PilX
MTVVPPFHHDRRRGVALIVAIAVSAILTVLVVGLSASHSVARQGNVASMLGHQARVLARAGLDTAMVLLAQVPAGSAVPKRTFTAEGGAYDVEIRPAGADEPAYDDQALAHRPGDAIVTVSAVARRGPHRRQVNQRYLVNASPDRARRVRLENSVSSERNP